MARRTPTPTRHRTLSVIIQGVLLLLLGAASLNCSSNLPEQTAEPPEPGWDELRSCPEDDTIWYRAVVQARRNDRLGELSRLVETLVEEHPSRWQPLWTLGECTLWRDGSPASPAAVDASELLFQRALGQARARDEPVGVARAHMRLAYVHKRRKAWPSAEQSYRAGLEAARAAGHDELEATIQINLAGRG